ncbi:MAG: SH3 domain-containing protein [Leptolyngbyaceae cyanobacterium]
MTWSNLAKLASGFVLAIALIVGGGYLMAQRLITQFMAPPPKPTFANDKPALVATASPAAKPTAGQPSPSPQASPQSNSSPSPAPSPSPTNGYPARITLDIGLNLRSAPNRDAERIGGIDYNQRVIVLEESPDKEWQRVRVEGTNLEGWVRGGYAEKLN